MHQVFKTTRLKPNVPVVGHVTFDQVTGGQGGHQRQLPRQHGTADHTGQLAGVLPRVARARALHPQHLTRNTSLV